MIGYRWLRAAARGAVGLLTALPAVALVLAVLVDRGPDGELRDPVVPPGPVRLRPLRLDLCAEQPDLRRCRDRFLADRRRRPGRDPGAAAILGPRRGAGRRGLVTRGATGRLAIGFLGIGGTSQPWPWLHSLQRRDDGRPQPGELAGAAVVGSVDLVEPALALALVTLATAAALERVEPAWLDAARLAGAGPLRTWHGLTWPLVRPAAARAAAIVFPLALFEPGVPLILGLRRTLAFQIVEAAARPEPFPRIAVWTVMAAVFSMAGRWLLRWWGGPALLDVADRCRNGVQSRSPAPRAGVALAVAGVAILAGTVALGWLPVFGLIRLLARAGSTGLVARRGLPASRCRRRSRSF